MYENNTPIPAFKNSTSDISINIELPVPYISSVYVQEPSDGLAGILLEGNTKSVTGINNTKDIATERNYISAVISELYIRELYSLPPEELMALYLGIFNVDPVDADVDGGLVDGNLYYNPVDCEFRIYQSSAWGSTRCSSIPYEFCPGYIYVAINSTTIRIEGLNVTNLFSVGRRLKIDGDQYANITASDYDATSAGNTTITVVMEDGSAMPISFTALCFVPGNTAWSPIASDPFGGYSINAITSGLIGTDTYWIAVGNGGKLGYSTDSGATWTMVTTGTTENLTCVAYGKDGSTPAFMVGGDVGVILTSTDGETWALDSSTLLTLATTGTANIDSVVYWPSYDTWIVLYEHLSTSKYTATSDNFGTTWTYRANISASSSGLALVQTQSTFYVLIGKDVYFSYIITPITTSEINSSNLTPGNITSVSQVYNDDANWFWVATQDNGAISINKNAALAGFKDSTTFSYRMNASTYSELFDRLIAVGNNSQIGYLDYANLQVADAWTPVANGFDPLANIKDVHADGSVIIAVADNGQICRSTNGTN